MGVTFVLWSSIVLHGATTGVFKVGAANPNKLEWRLTDDFPHGVRIRFFAQHPVHEGMRLRVSVLVTCRSEFISMQALGDGCQSTSNGMVAPFSNRRVYSE